GIATGVAGGFGFSGPLQQMSTASGQLAAFTTTGANGYLFVGKRNGSNEGVFIGEIGDVPFISTNSTVPLEIRQNGGALGPAKVSPLPISGIASGTPCVHANSSRVLSGTGSDCGSGGAGTAIFYVGPQ